MCYRIAGIDVHKRMLAVVVADVATEGDYEFERRQFGANPDELRRLADWLIAQNVQEVVMESTAQYWRPVWNTLERYWSAQCRGAEGAGPMSGSLLLALAQSNRGPRGRKRDFVDAERLLKRLVAQELVLSFVPDAEQRVWRTVVRRKYQLTRDRVRLQNQLESLLEEAQVKLSSLVSDLLGLSAHRMLRARRWRNRSSSPRRAWRSPTSCQPGAVVRCAWGCYRPQKRLSPTRGHGAGRIAANRTPHEPTGSRDGGPAEFASRCCSAPCRGAWSRSRVGSSDHRRGRRRSENISFGEASGFVDWSVPR